MHKILFFKLESAVNQVLLFLVNQMKNNPSEIKRGELWLAEYKHHKSVFRSKLVGKMNNDDPKLFKLDILKSTPF